MNCLMLIDRRLIGIWPIVYHAAATMKRRDAL